MDEQSASYGKKVQEKRQEVKRLKAMAEKVQNALTDTETHTEPAAGASSGGRLGATNKDRLNAEKIRT